MKRFFLLLITAIIICSATATVVVNAGVPEQIINGINDYYVVGGVTIQVDKIGLLLPWISGIVAITAVVASILWKTRQNITI